MSRTLASSTDRPSVGWLVSNVKTNNHAELFKTELASSRMRAGVCIQGCLQAGLRVLPLNFREASDQPSLVFMAKYVHDSNTAQFLDDSGQRWALWKEKIEALKARSGIFVMDYTDNHFKTTSVVGDFYRMVRPMVDALVVPSEKMREHLGEAFKGPVTVIPEPIEVPLQPVRRYTGGPRVALWFGHNSNLKYLIDFMQKGMASEPPEQLLVLTNNVSQPLLNSLAPHCPKGVKVTMAPWSKATMLKAAAQSHFCIVASNRDDPQKNGASPGRLLTSLALGLPTLAEPLESYLPFSDFFVSTRSNQVGDFLKNPGSFAQGLEQAQALIESTFSVRAIGKQWADFAQQSLGRART